MQNLQCVQNNGSWEKWKQINWQLKKKLLETNSEMKRDQIDLYRKRKLYVNYHFHWEQWKWLFNTVFEQ